MESVNTPQKNTTVTSALLGLMRFRELTLVAMIIIIGIVLHAATNGRFFTTANLNAIMLGFATSAIIMVGMTAALVSGGFDLSVGSVFALGGVATALALRADIPIVLAVLIGMGAGVLSGFFTGILITKVRINPFISTLGMLSIARGISLALTQGSPLASLPQEFFWLGQGRLGDVLPFVQGTFFDIPILIVIALIVVIIGDVLMRRTALFRRIYYVGGNEDAARLSGINVDRVLIGVYTLCGSLAALAGVLSVSRFTVADPGTGAGEELRLIAACIIGGASLKGGKGTVIGGLLGLIFVGFINNGMVLLRVPVYWQSLVTGVILLLAVGFDTLNQRLQQRAK